MVDLSIRPTPVLEDLDYVLQQIDILFDTHPGDTVNSEYGTEYERLLFDTLVGASQIESEVIQDLNQLDLRGWNPSVKVSLHEGTERDIALVQIELRKNDSIRSVNYQIS